VVLGLLALLPALQWPAPARAQLQGGGIYPVNGVDQVPVAFANLASAISYLAAYGVSGEGEVILELGPQYPGESEPLIIPEIPGAAPARRILLRPAEGTSAITSVAGDGAQAFALRIDGSFISLDGRSGGAGTGRSWTIRCTGTGSSGHGQSAVRIGPASPSSPQTDVAIRWCILEAEAASITSAIVAVEGSGQYPLRNLLIEHNLVRSAGPSPLACRGHGISLAKGNNVGNTGLRVVNNLIHDVFARGISYTGGFPGGLVAGNDIFHTMEMTPPDGSEFAAIFFSNTISGGTVFEENFVHDIRLASGTEPVHGILLFNGNSTGSPVRLVNNRIVLTGSFPTRALYGIRDLSTSHSLFDVDFNSVYLGGTASTGNAPSAAFRREMASAVHLRGNILSNARNNAGGSGTHWAISLGGRNGVLSLSGNDYHVSGAGGVMGTDTGGPEGNRHGILEWREAVPADSTSFSQDPYFVDPLSTPPDLRIRTSIPSRVESGARFAPAVAVDFEGDARHGSEGYQGTGSAPDTGADEFEGTPAAEIDVAAVALIQPPAGGTQLGGTPFAPQATFENVGEIDQPEVRVRYRLAGPAPDTTVVYQDSLVVALDAGAGPLPVSFAALTLESGGTYTMVASVGLPGDLSPVNDQVSGEFELLLPLAGSYDVGNGAPPPFDSLRDALARLRHVGASGPVVFRLVDSLYTSPSEEIPVVIAPFPGAGFDRTLTIRPSRPGTAIRGASLTAVVIFDDADHVILEGSSGGDGTRDLTIANESTSPGTAAIWMKSSGPGSGAQHNGVHHCHLQAGIDQSSGNGATFGIFSGGPSIAAGSGGAGNDHNVFRGNSIRRARWGVYLAGDAQELNRGNTVEGNVVGPDDFGGDQIGQGGIILRHQDLAVVTGNEIRRVGVLSGQAAAGADRVGIGLGGEGWPPSLSPVTQSRISGNLIHDLADEKTFSVAGIVVAGTGAPSGNVVANNMLSALRSNGTGGDHVAGIGIAAGEGDIVAHNSIALAGDLDPPGTTTCSQSGAAVRIATSAVANLTLKNNIALIDLSGNNPAVKHYAIIAPPPPFSWGAGGCDHNDYFPLPSNPQASLGAIGNAMPYTEVPTLEAWRGQFSPPQDSSSISADPLFASSTDLHIVDHGDATSPVAGAGVALPAVPIDFDGQVREAVPDAGADEFTTFPLFVTVQGRGRVDRAPTYPSYNDGATVELTAIPDSGWSFTAWGGDLDGSENPASLLMDDPKAVTAIFDDLLGLTIADGSIAEGDSGVFSLDFVVTLGAGSRSDTASVAYATVDSTAQAQDGDYGPAEGRLRFPPGTATDTIRVDVAGDIWSEGDEVLRVILFDPRNLRLTDSSAIGTIQDDDPLPLIAVDDVTVSESDTSFVDALFTISLSRAAGRTVTVRAITADSTAIADSDYVALDPVLVEFAPRDTLLQRAVAVRVIPDLIVEPTEFFRLLLFDPVHAALADSEGLGTILDPESVAGVKAPPPAVTTLEAGYPNPFCAGLRISFQLRAAGSVSLDVHDVQGRRLRRLFAGQALPGRHLVHWNGAGDDGQPLPAGVYFVRLQTSGRSWRQAVVRLR